MEENRKKVEENAKKIIDNGKGILAADESPDSIKKRFDLYDIENSEENRRKFRNIMLTTEGIENMIGGVILHEETFEQKADNGKLFVDLLAEKGIAPGIKLDLGLKDFCDNEKICLGIEDLDERLKKESFRKAVFAKWRCVFSVSKGQPSMKCIDANCEILARYSEICQKHGIVPIVEPELLWDGSHTFEEATLATTTILSNLVVHLNQSNVHLPGVLLKMAFVTAGKEKGSDFDYEQVANVTYHCIRSNIPQTIAGVVFLSGGHTKEDSTVFLDKINKAKRESYILTFSYGRALSDVVLSEWKADDKNIDNAVKAFKARVSETYKASQGQYQ